MPAQTKPLAQSCLSLIAPTHGTLSTEAQAHLQHWAQEVAGQLHAPIALITAVTEHGVFFLAQHGLHGWPAQLGVVPAQWSCCTHTAEHARPHLVSDATVDAEHRANPLVRRFGLVSYAGVPVHRRDGSITGTVCVLDTRPRTFDTAHVRVLQHLARQVQQVLHPSPAALHPTRHSTQPAW